MFKEDISKGKGSAFLTLGALPLLAFTATVVEALVAGIAIIAILVVTSILVKVGTKMVPESRLVIAVASAATASIGVSTLVNAAVPELHNLGIYLPVLALSSLVLSVAIGCGDETGGDFVVAGSMGLKLVLAMAAVGFVREFLGLGQVFGMQVVEAPAHIIGLAPGAFFAAASVIALLQWAESRAENSPVDRASSGVTEAEGR